MLRFSVSAQLSFSYETMCMGRDRLEYYLAELRKKGDEASKKEQDSIRDMRIVQEMYARGFEFLPIDIYRSHANRFQIIDGKLLPPLNSIDGMGDKAAEAVVEAAKQGKFLSKDDFRDRTKVSKTVIDLMDDLGCSEIFPSPISSPCLMWCDCLTLLFTRYCPVRLL